MSCGLLVLSAAPNFAQVGVNILTPHPSAALHIESPPGTFRGLLTPSLTTTNRMAMFSGTNTVSDGLIVYDINHRMHYSYNGGISRWVSFSPFTLSTPTIGSTSFPSGVITTPSSSATFFVGINKQNPTAALDVVGNLVVSSNINASGAITSNGPVNANANLNVGGSLNVNGFPSNALVPAGTIVMWSGNAIPSGWAQCDGSNGTPDLRGRFIVASGQSGGSPAPGDSNPNYSANNTGGENFHTLSKAEIPRHTHQASGDGANMTASGGSHFHYANPHGQGVGAQRAGGSSGGLANDSPQTIATDPASVAFSNGEFAGHSGDGTTDGLNGQALENRPQYYVLKFIMKL
jgi:microcystin-dependent protein